VVSELKQASRRREDEGRRISEEVRNLKEGIPKALEGAKEGSDKRLKELGAEIRSLKTLMGNRLGAATPPAAPASSQASRPTGPYPVSGNVLGSSSTPTLPREPEETPTPINGAANETPSNPTSVVPPRREGNASPFPSSSSGARAIPAWQMAAAKKASAQPEVSDATDGESQSGTVA
jgi:peroxin-14